MRTDSGDSLAAEQSAGSKVVPDVVICLTIQHNRNRYHLELKHDCTVGELKDKLEAITNVPVNKQKLIFRGVLKDESKVSDLQLPARNAKIMLIGIEKDVYLGPEVTATTQTIANRENEPPTEEDKRTIAAHKHVIETFGKPDNAKASLPLPETLADNETLTGLLDKRGKPLRLRFHPESSELWMATSSATYKIPLDTIKAVEHYPITSHPGYHIMSFQLGPTRKSRFFIYWVPEQYVDSIKKKALVLKPVTRNTPATTEPS